MMADIAESLSAALRRAVEFTRANHGRMPVLVCVLPDRLYDEMRADGRDMSLFAKRGDDHGRC